jgi:hypothetical protein
MPRLSAISASPIASPSSGKVTSMSRPSNSERECRGSVDRFLYVSARAPRFCIPARALHTLLSCDASRTTWDTCALVNFMDTALFGIRLLTTAINARRTPWGCPAHALSKQSGTRSKHNARMPPPSKWKIHYLSFKAPGETCEGFWSFAPRMERGGWWPVGLRAASSWV